MEAGVEVVRIRFGGAIEICGDANLMLSREHH